jgi:integrase
MVEIRPILYYFLWSLPKHSIFVIGTRTRTSNFCVEHWKKVREKFRLSKQYVPYTIRHTIITRKVIDEKMDMATLGGIVDHSNPATTLTTYTHLKAPLAVNEETENLLDYSIISP